MRYYGNTLRVVTAMSSNTICKVKVIGKHRFLKSDVEYTVSGRDGDYVALEGLDYGCAWHISNFVGVHKFKVGDRVDFINPNAVRGLPTTNLKVVDINEDLVRIEWPDGKSGWWCVGSFKPHEHVHRFKVGDRVDFISKAAIGNEQRTNLEVVDVLKSMVKIKWPDGAVGWRSEERLRLHVPESKVRVLHTNVMYYVMPDGNVFYQGPLLKSDFTLESLLKLDGIVEVTK